jgi:hypothetical protein
MPPLAAVEGMGMTTPWIVVVDRQRADLFAHLSRRLAGQARVILDRRRRPDPASSRDDRRESFALTDAALWHECGVRVVVPERDGTDEGYRARAEVRRLVNQLAPRLARTS